MDVVDLRRHEPHAIMPALRHPDRHVIRGQPAPPADLQGLAEEILRGAGEHARCHDEAEADEFGVEGIPVAPLQRIVEARIPVDDRDRDIDQREFRADDGEPAGAMRSSAPRSGNTAAPAAGRCAARARYCPSAILSPPDGADPTRSLYHAGAARRGGAADSTIIPTCCAIHHRTGMGNGLISNTFRPLTRRHASFTCVRQRLLASSCPLPHSPDRPNR